MQHLAVKHIVERGDKVLNLLQDKKDISGKTPSPYSEADYDSWNLHVDLTMKDTSLSQIEDY